MPKPTIRSAAALAIVSWMLAACASAPKPVEDPLIKKMKSYVGWNIGTFMSDWGMRPTQSTNEPEGVVYQFEKLQGSLKCNWTIRTNDMGNIVQWSMRGNACPNADGP